MTLPDPQLSPSRLPHNTCIVRTSARFTPCRRRVWELRPLANNSGAILSGSPLTYLYVTLGFSRAGSGPNGSHCPLHRQRGAWRLKQACLPVSRTAHRPGKRASTYSDLFRGLTSKSSARHHPPPTPPPRNPSSGGCSSRERPPASRSSKGDNRRPLPSRGRPNCSTAPRPPNLACRLKLSATRTTTWPSTQTWQPL